jgi:hypothetical protein
MARHVINTTATHAQVLRAIQRAINSATGAGPQAAIVRALQVRIGLTALGFIKVAFVEKARGGTDEAGDRWQPLSPYTIAYHRRHREVSKKTGQVMKKKWLPSQNKRAGYAPSYQLTSSQRSRWWDLYYHYRQKWDKGHAAAAAWLVLKAEGAKTLMDVYGSAQVEILRDTGLLLTSLSPAVAPGGGETTPPRTKEQVFQLGAGRIMIGTNRKWAETHHHGVPGRIPQRRLWPHPTRWPRRWGNEMVAQLGLGLIEVIRSLLP